MIKQLSRLLQRLGGDIADPARHSQELIVVFLALLIVIAFIAVVYRLVFPGAAAETAGPGFLDKSSDELLMERARRKKRSPAAVAGLVILGLALSGLLATTLVYSASSQFCANCHKMKPYYRSWKQAKHRRVECSACHQKPGALGFLAAKAAGWRNYSLSSIYNARSRPIARAKIDNDSCLQCHQDVLATKTFKGKIKIRHQDFAAELTCSRCHLNSGHKTVAKPPTKRGIMADCLYCHRQKKCSFCHLNDPNSVVKDKDSYALVNITNRYCKRCHTVGNCVKCHKASQLMILIR